ncbi:MAG: hypothetical protein EON92_06985 [Burkholderiales bacterium]|nr:MAG: hypothetical protein EON92_06985 [Burkholderiales bacterium]
MNLDTRLNRFRLASRELFNLYFRVEDASGAGTDPEAWGTEERFGEVERILFEKLVLEPMQMGGPTYGRHNAHIQVLLRSGRFARIMLNRDVDSGYWDHPIREVTEDATLEFVSFFDWDQLHYRDHRYVRVFVGAWPSQPAAVGKHALIESQYVRYSEG